MTRTENKVLVTGGTGFVGEALIQKLIQQGNEVHSLSRRKNPALEKIGVIQHSFDLASGETQQLLSLLGGVSSVFHTAAKVEMWGDYDDFFKVNVLGTRALLKASQSAGVRRFIYTSSPSVVSSGGDLCGVDETCPYPEHYLAPYPKTKAEAEREVLSANSERFRTVSLRPHLIFGPGDKNLIPTVLYKAKKGRLVQVGDGSNLVVFSYIEDCVRAHLLADEALMREAESGVGIGEGASGEAFFISQEEPTLLWGWINQVLEYNGLPAITRKIPYSVAYCLAIGSEFVSRILPGVREPLLTRFLVSEMAHNHYFSGAKARRLLGYEPRYSMSEAMKCTFQRSNEESEPPTFSMNCS